MKSCLYCNGIGFTDPATSAFLRIMIALLAVSHCSSPQSKSRHNTPRVTHLVSSTGETAIKLLKKARPHRYKQLSSMRERDRESIQATAKRHNTNLASGSGKLRRITKCPQTGKNVTFLTFDDGPVHSPAHAQPLSDNNVKATYFWLTWDIRG